MMNWFANVVANLVPTSISFFMNWFANAVANLVPTFISSRMNWFANVVANPVLTFISFMMNIKLIQKINPLKSKPSVENCSRSLDFEGQLSNCLI